MASEGKLKRSVQACSRCRQQKMKCDGNGTPPCSRCRRAKTACIFEAPLKLPAHHERVYQYGSSHAGDAVPSPPDSVNFHKRRRLNFETLSTTSSPDSRDPYTTVLALENEVYPSTCHGIDLEHDTEHLTSTYLTKAGMTADEGLEMFTLFGQRIAHFMPTMVDAEFTKLPCSPLFCLAAIYTVARYLPETVDLRKRCGNLLRQLLSGLLFDRTESKSIEYLRETLHGLATLYAYCEANDRDVKTGSQDWRFDMLSIKGVIEGYVVKLGVAGLGHSRTSTDPLFSLYWLWLYTLSHYTATIHGCARSIWAAAGIYRAKTVVEKNYDNYRVSALIAEVELCLVWECVAHATEFTVPNVNEELHKWSIKWKYLLDDALRGRHARFHQGYATFRLRCWLLALKQDGSDRAILENDKICAARKVLTGLLDQSPIVKDKLRYMCDYGFVIIAYVAVSLLRDIKSRDPQPEDSELASEKLIQIVRSVAALMQSYGGIKGTRAAIYGHALHTICESINQGARAQAGQHWKQASATALIATPVSTSQHSELNSSESGSRMPDDHIEHTPQILNHDPRQLGSMLHVVGHHTPGWTMPSTTTEAQQKPPTSHPTHYMYAEQPRAIYPYFDDSNDYMDIFNDLVGMSHLLPGAGYNPLYAPDPDC